MTFESEVADLVVVQVLRAYARQSRLIDSGDAAGWASTFTHDGEFNSPSYPAPARGAAELQAFAHQYAEQGAASGMVSRHVITNVDVLPGRDAEHVTAHAYLQIVSTPTGGESHLARITTITDQLVRPSAAPLPGAPADRSSDSRWLVSHRQVLRDDEGLPLVPHTPSTATESNR